MNGNFILWVLIQSLIRKNESELPLGSYLTGIDSWEKKQLEFCFPSLAPMCLTLSHRCVSALVGFCIVNKDVTHFVRAPVSFISN